MSGEKQTESAIVIDEKLTRTEIQIEQEKLKLEHERVTLARERLEAERARLDQREMLHTDSHGRLTVSLSNMVLVSIICILAGGILGAITTSTHFNRRSSARLQEVMQTISSVQVAEISTESNEVAEASSKLPAWLRVVQPKSSHSGVSLLVIQ